MLIAELLETDVEKNDAVLPSDATITDKPQPAGAG